MLSNTEKTMEKVVALCKACLLYTSEIGRGENPLPLSSFERIYEKLEETLLLAALM